MNMTQVLKKLTLNKKNFDVVDGWTIEVKETAKGTVSKQLANFIAWPVKEIEYDDGQEIKRLIEIKGMLADKRKLPAFRVTSEEFWGDLSGVLSKQWGLDVILSLGQKRAYERQYSY